MVTMRFRLYLRYLLCLGVAVALTLGLILLGLYGGFAVAQAYTWAVLPALNCPGGSYEVHRYWFSADLVCTSTTHVIAEARFLELPPLFIGPIVAPVVFWVAWAAVRRSHRRRSVNAGAMTP